MDFKLELVIVPFSDVDRARDFYVDTVGFALDHDQTVSEEIRFVQLTPAGRRARSHSAEVCRPWNRVPSKHCSA